MLYSNLKQFDVILSQEKPDFDSIQSSFKLLYSSVSLNPELSDIFGRFYHFKTKIYERHYFNNRINFESVPNLNSVSLGYSIELKSGVKSDVVCHPIDYQVNIDTIKFAHEIATLRAASSFLNKKIYHTADKTDVELMLSSQGKKILNLGKQKVTDALVEDNNGVFVKKDIKHVHCDKSTLQANKSLIVRTSDYNHSTFCDLHLQRIEREFASSDLPLNRQIILTSTRRIFMQSKIKNDVSLLSEISETEYTRSLVITNDFFSEN